MSAPEKISTLITGASSGIGEAFARALAAKGHDLILVARRVDRLEALAGELGAKHGVTVMAIPVDLSLPDAADTLVAAAEAKGLRVDWLINNAGYGVSGSFDSKDWPIHADFLRVMIETPTALIHRLLPAMRERGYGRIVNVASLAAHVHAPAGNTLYGAAKAYLVKISEALAAENEDRDIKVLAVSPGFTLSEFHDVTGTRAMMDKMPAWAFQTSEQVVGEALAALDAGKPIHITGRANRIIAKLNAILPDKAAIALMKRQGKRYRKSGR